ncbi:MAG: ribonuclease HII [Clostridiales bacterium]|nr:ribonuclease HII [Clostridiales bacterium]
MSSKNWESKLNEIILAYEKKIDYFVGPVVQDEHLDHLFWLRFITGEITSMVNNHVFYYNILPTDLGLEYHYSLNSSIKKQQGKFTKDNKTSFHPPISVLNSATFEYDNQFKGLTAGIDEAGRGALAGPVVCAAYIAKDFVEGVNDSKKLTSLKREELFDKILENSLDYCISSISNTIIDEINILNATKKGMVQAVCGLNMVPDFVLIDHVKVDLSNTHMQSAQMVSITNGDNISYSIAAASILAKVARDRAMLELNEMYPQYGFSHHKGYGTEEHFKAIQKFGVTKYHRKSFLKNLQM